MKKTAFILCFISISLITNAQKFETNISVSPIMTFGSNVTSDNAAGSKIAIGFSGAISEFYNVSNKFAIGTELNYAYNNYIITYSYMGVRTMEANSNWFYKSKINTQSLNIPLFLRFKTKNNWIFQLGFGVTYILNSKSHVDFVVSDWSNNNEEFTTVASKNDCLNKDFNNYINITLGKRFSIVKAKMFAEIYYEKAFQNYSFEHNGIKSEFNYIYKLNPQHLGLKIGIEL